MSECANAPRKIDTEYSYIHGICGYDICQWFITTNAISLFHSHAPHCTISHPSAGWLTKTHQSDELKFLIASVCSWKIHTHSRFFLTFSHVHSSYSLYSTHSNVCVYIIPCCYCATTVCSLCRPFSTFLTCYCSSMLAYECESVSMRSNSFRTYFSIAIFN